MVEELDDMERRRLFSRPEIDEIVRRRRDFEYRLKRPRPIRQDFLDYVDYESKVDHLRLLRKRVLAAELRRNNKRWKRSLSDFAGVKRIVDIYRLATIKFKGDMDLWFRYLEFCRWKRHGTMRKVLAKAIRYHPKVPGLWIYAAAWEFDCNLNVTSARSLMQSGLRACPNSEDLWVEYLRMELTYLNKLKARKAALGEDSGKENKTVEMDENAKQWKEDNIDLFMPLSEKENVEGFDPQEQNAGKKTDAFQERSSRVFQTIYRGAVEAIPSSMNLCKRFVEILDDVELSHSDKLREEIMEDIRNRFSQEEDYWDWLAKLQIRNCKMDKELTREEILGMLLKAVQVYEEALEILPSAKMFSVYAKFLMDTIFPEDDDIQSSIFMNIKDDSLEFSSHMMELYQKAESSGCINEDLAYHYVSFLVRMDRQDEASKLSEKLCNGELSDSAKMWVLRISIEMKCMTNKSVALGKNDLQSIFDLLGHALTRIDIPEAECLWLMGVKFFSNKKKFFEKLVSSFIMVLARAPLSDSGHSISSAIVNCIMQRDGIAGAREMYKRFLALPRPSLAFYKHCIDLERNLAFIGDNDSLMNARKLFESVLSIYNQHGGLWQDYHSMEVKVGSSETTNAVYWRARKTLGDASWLSALRSS
ncbi:hypothetical protein QJS10_CPB11g01373 [Acorus calamus]|uniref:U3 small nucleolar RNA-associated protein 6 n=1 Tax=Acorus calamus TaxID=4465 RepID=A0AAV9DQ45_ACOCL|nr:hypothetical protein QJS10_CPB11g01373 [Acorus calamus]